jgi:hypothetical protein
MLMLLLLLLLSLSLLKGAVQRVVIEDRAHGSRRTPLAHPSSPAHTLELRISKSRQHCNVNSFRIDRNRHAPRKLSHGLCATTRHLIESYAFQTRDTHCERLAMLDVGGQCAVWLANVRLVSMQAAQARPCR